ncbi:hypothetical protein EZV62_011033 [Acer yangbiense]|uniref:Glabrous enhancer-binding protein-like DBD domain-containing protein n=1 Tax=Acer yangbiense TaxID=1000413 RepID=A0A5C7I592_9ROSI|nr:hypothetical protein EZV62_011033 [Acer yangbiense]
MIEFSTKKGVDPNQDMNAFHDFIKKSLHIDVTRTQLVDKIRRLKKKYENNIERGIKKGEVRTLSKPHEQKAYDLSKKVWGGEGGVLETASKSNGKARKTQNQRGSSKQLAASKVESVNGPKDVEKMDVDNDKELSLKTPVDVEKFLFDNSLGVTGFEDYVVKNGLAMIKGSKKMKLEQRWKKLHIAQLELYVERIDLVKEQALLVLESLKSSDKGSWSLSLEIAKVIEMGVTLGFDFHGNEDSVSEEVAKRILEDEERLREIRLGIRLSYWRKRLIQVEKNAEVAGWLPSLKEERLSCLNKLWKAIKGEEQSHFGRKFEGDRRRIEASGRRFSERRRIGNVEEARVSNDLIWGFIEEEEEVRDFGFGLSRKKKIWEFLSDDRLLFVMEEVLGVVLVEKI